MLPHKDVQALKEVMDIMHEESVTLYGEKKEALARGDEAVQRQVGGGKDILSILCKSPKHLLSIILVDFDKCHNSESEHVFQ